MLMALSHDDWRPNSISAWVQSLLAAINLTASKQLRELGYCQKLWYSKVKRKIIKSISIKFSCRELSHFIKLYWQSPAKKIKLWYYVNFFVRILNTISVIDFHTQLKGGFLIWPLDMLQLRFSSPKWTGWCHQLHVLIHIDVNGLLIIIIP